MTKLTIRLTTILWDCKYCISVYASKNILHHKKQEILLHNITTVRKTWGWFVGTVNWHRKLIPGRKEGSALSSVNCEVWTLVAFITAAMSAICSTTVPVRTRLYWSTDSWPVWVGWDGPASVVGREAQCGRRTKINWNKDYSPHIAVVWLQVVHWALDKKASACGGYVMLLLFFKYQFYFLGYLCCMHSGIPYSQQ